MQTILSNERLESATDAPTASVHNVASVHLEERDIGGILVTVVAIRDARGRELLNLDLYSAKALLGSHSGRCVPIEYVEHQPEQKDAAA